MSAAVVLASLQKNCFAHLTSNHSHATGTTPRALPAANGGHKTPNFSNSKQTTGAKPPLSLYALQYEQLNLNLLMAAPRPHAPDASPNSEIASATWSAPSSASMRLPQHEKRRENKRKHAGFQSCGGRVREGSAYHPSTSLRKEGMCACCQLVDTMSS